MSMDFSLVESIAINASVITELKEGNTTLWQQSVAPSEYGYAIVQINENDFATKTPFESTTYPASVTINGNTYQNSANGFSCAIGTSLNDWATHGIVNGIKPVYITNGAIDGEPANKRDMSTWDTTKDVFTEFPFNWLGIVKDNGVVTIIFSDNDTNPDNTIFMANAFLDNSNVQQNAFHIGCTEWDTNDGSKVGSSAKVNTSITNFISYATTKGTQYDLVTYDQATYIIALAVLLYKTPNLQGTGDTTHGLGMGRVNTGSVQASQILTFDNDFGMYGTTANQTTTVSFFWILDLYGNTNTFVGSAYINALRQLKICRGKRSSVTESDFNVTVATGLSANVSGACVMQTLGTSDGGFLPIQTSGTDYTKGYSDYGRVYASYFPYWGGNYSNGDLAGVFYWSFNISATYTYAYIGSRLSCKIAKASA